MSEDGLTPEELNKRANEDWNKIQEDEASHPNVSQADKSMITHPDQDKKSIAEGIIADLGNQRQDIDSLKGMMAQVIEQQNQLAGMVNQQTQAINQLAQGGQQGAPAQPGQLPQGLNMETLGALGDVLEKGISAYKSLKGGPPAAAPLIDQEFINKRMVETFMDDLDTGKSIGDFIKNSLKKQATRQIINSSLKDIGNNEPTHAPQ